MTRRRFFTMNKPHEWHRRRSPCDRYVHRLRSIFRESRVTVSSRNAFSSRTYLINLMCKLGVSKRQDAFKILQSRKVKAARLIPSLCAKLSPPSLYDTFHPSCFSATVSIHLLSKASNNRVNVLLHFAGRASIDFVQGEGAPTRVFAYKNRIIPSSIKFAGKKQDRSHRTCTSLARSLSSSLFLRLFRRRA